jgi:hypothetical protein
MLPPLRIAPSWWKRMSSGSYFPPPVKAVPIPKKSGGVRSAQRVSGPRNAWHRRSRLAIALWRLCALCKPGSHSS